MSTDELPTVAEIMNTRVDTLLPDEPLEEAVNLLVRRGYSGQGGPLTPLSFTTRGEDGPSG